LFLVSDPPGLPRVAQHKIINRMSICLEESYQHCMQIARTTAKNFYHSFRVMPPEKRQAMSSIYAFMRRSDDIADDAADPSIALKNLRNWRVTIDAAFNNQPTDDPMLPALVDTVKKYKIPIHYFHELLDGTEMDQRITRYETFEELYQYCYRVASIVGLTVLPIFGYRDETALKPAEACGIAFQLTNILRDVKEDARMGRIYLPLEDLRRFGVEERDIMQFKSTPEFVEMMRFQAARAREYYQRATPLLNLIEPDSRGTLAVMIGIYGGILDRIEKLGFTVFENRVQLSGWAKMWIVLKNWMRYS